MSYFQEDPNYRHCMDYCMRALSMRSHGVEELRKKLRKRPHHTEEYETTIISRLLELGLLNDELFIKRKIESCTQVSYQGPYKILMKLKQKGIDGNLFWKIWGEMKINEKEVAEKALQKKLRQWTKLESHKRKAKAAQFLAGRGFTSEITYQLIGKL